MTNYQAGDLVLIEFPFTTGGAAKPRPALVIVDTGDADVLVARVTTQQYNTAYDLPIAAWKAAGLLAPSFVRLHKLATLAKSRILRQLGSLDAADRQQVAAVLTTLAASW
jgi:mRNA interferase MazF